MTKADSKQLWLERIAPGEAKRLKWVEVIEIVLPAFYLCNFEASFRQIFKAVGWGVRNISKNNIEGVLLV